MKNLSRIIASALLVGLFGMTALAADFKDVPSSHVNYKAIMDLKNRGIIGGYPDGTFKPDQVVNRVEALKIILGAAKITVDGDAAMGLAGFTDVDASQWYAPYLRKALSLQIVQGYPDATFRPTQTVNLVENLKILLNAEKIDVSKMAVSLDPFADAPKDQWYAKFVQYAKEKMLVEADSSNKIYPAQGMTRAKLAETVFRLLWVQEKGLDFYGQVKEDGTGSSVPSGQTPGRDETLLVNIKDMKFTLAEMTIPQGATVRWTNSDSVPHTVTSTSGAELSSPSLANGDTFEHIFSKLGTFEYECSLHPSMKGKIIVKPAEQVPTI